MRFDCFSSCSLPSFFLLCDSISQNVLSQLFTLSIRRHLISISTFEYTYLTVPQLRNRF